MSTTLVIAPDLKLPAESVTETFAILGKRGSGKTNTAVVLVEELIAAKLPVCIVDPVGVWWGLRAGADGREAGGLPVTIVGGDHGDVPLEESAGHEIASFVVEEHAQVLLDLSHLRKAAQTRFMTAFAESLYHLKSSSRTPLHVVVDEADAFAPQRTGPEGARLLGAMEDLIRRGRSRGIGMTLITQRPAVLNKNVLTQAEVLVVMKLTSPQDHAAIRAWVESHDENDENVALDLASLPVGDAWFWSPGWLDVFQRVHVRARRTFDSSATPKPGAPVAAPRELAAVDLDALKQRIAATVKAGKTDDPKALKARVAELEKQLREVKVPRVSDALFRAVVEVRAAVRGTIGKIEALEKSLGDVYPEGSKNQAFSTYGKFDNGVMDQAKVRTEGSNGNGKIVIEIEADPSPADLRRTLEKKREIIGDKLAGGERRILTVLAQHPEGLSAVQVALMVGYSSKSGGYRNYLSALRSSFRIEGGGDRIQITQGGRKSLGTYEPLPKGKALLDHWLANVGGRCERKILEELASQHPRSLSKEAVANRIGYQASSGGYRNALSRLRTLQLINGRGDLGLTKAFAGAIS